MFIVFGILSILAGVFVFVQGSTLSVLSSIAKSTDGSALSGAFIITAICLIIAGAFSCACSSGTKRGFVKVSIVAYFFASFIDFVFKVGDLRIWAIVCLVMGILYIIWLIRHKKPA